MGPGAARRSLFRSFRLRLGVLLLLAFTPLVLLSLWQLQRSHEMDRARAAQVCHNLAAAVSDIYVTEFLARQQESLSMLINATPRQEFQTGQFSSATHAIWRNFLARSGDLYNLFYYHLDSKRLIVFPSWEAPAEFVATERPWYDAGLRGRNRYNWTSVYWDAVTGMPTVSLTRRVYDATGSRLLGVAVVDTPLLQLMERLQALEFEAPTTLSLVDRDGRIVSHPDRQRAAESVAPPLLEWMRSVDFDGRSADSRWGRLLAATPVPGTRWVLLAERSSGDLAASLEGRYRTWALNLALGIAAYLLIWWLLVRQVEREAGALAAAIRRVGDGDTETPDNAVPVRMAEFHGVRDALKATHSRLRDLELSAATDPMTGALNRKTLVDSLESLHQREEPYGMILVDLDHFKEINDRYGHQTGDAVLQEFVAVTHSQLRDDDLLFRYGGEEFCILLPGLMLEQVIEVAERLRRALADHRWSPPEMEVSFSAGVVCSQAGMPPENLFREADQLLYRAKSNGRGRIESLRGAA